MFQDGYQTTDVFAMHLCPSAQVPVAPRMMDDIFTLPHKRVKMPWRVRDWEVEKCWSWKEIYFMASGEVGLS